MFSSMLGWRSSREGRRVGMEGWGERREEAFVIRTFRNGLAGFVSKYVIIAERGSLLISFYWDTYRLGIEGPMRNEPVRRR